MVTTYIFDLLGVVVRNKKIDQAVVDIIQELKDKNKKVVALSNISHDYWYRLHNIHSQLNHLFDQCYFSSDIDYYKPDPRAYQYVLKNEKITASNCIFIDDSTVNVASAQNLGIVSIHFQSAKQLQTALQKLF